jgi:hypothetical protein
LQNEIAASQHSIDQIEAGLQPIHMSTKVDTAIEAFYSRVRGAEGLRKERLLIQANSLGRRWQSTCIVEERRGLQSVLGLIDSADLT